MYHIYMYIYGIKKTLAQSEYHTYKFRSDALTD